MASASTARNLLMKQYKDLQKSPVPGFRPEIPDETDFFKWVVWVRGPSGSPYAGGIFKALLNFPADFPFQPPSMQFASTLWHPNIYSDGRVCISILHAPGEDEFGYENAAERWSPVQTVESVLISVISMLAEPNDESPANVDAAVQWRNKNADYNKKCKDLVTKANAQLPDDFIAPSDFDAQQKAPTSEDRPGTSSMSWVPEDDGDGDAEEDEEAELNAKVKQLVDMGAGDEAKCREVLVSCKGEIDRAIDKLFSE